MLDRLRKRAPSFSIGSLLLLTSAIAIGFAVSQSPSRGEPIGWSSIYPADFRVPEGLACGGSLLVAVELLRQSWQLRQDLASSVDQVRFSILSAAVQRFAIAAAIFSLVLMRLLLNRKLIALPDMEEFIHVYGDLWPDLMFEIVLIVAIRMMLDRRNTTQSIQTQWMLNSIVAFGIVGVLAHLVIDRNFVPYLVHVAVEQIELHQPMKLQRLEVYPNHRVEEFWSFWQATIAAGMALLAVFILILAPNIKSTWGRCCVFSLLVTLVTGLAGYAKWFCSVELPRISPEMASAGLASRWVDRAAWALIVLGIAIWIGNISGARASDLSLWNTRLPKTSQLVILGVVPIALASMWKWLWLLREALNVPGVLHGWGTLVDAIRSVGVIMLYPEMMIPLVLVVSTCTLIWQALSDPNTSPPLVLVEGRQFALYSVAWLAVLLVGIPTLAIFGFCYWLGPWIL